MEYKNLIDQITKTCKNIFWGNLSGVYLHGSIAMGCFNPNKSDIDLIIVIKDDITDDQKLEFMKQVVKLNEKAPKKGLELSIVKNEVCHRFVYPTPFVMHFSPMHLEWFHKDPVGYVKNMKGIDKDLAAHFTIIRRYGIVLYGAAISETFSEVPREDYIDSIWDDIQNAKEDILNDAMYIILNLCRALAYIKEGLVLSKVQGGEWGRKNTPSDYYELIQSALDCYTSDTNIIVEKEKAIAFAEYMLEKIHSSI